VYGHLAITRDDDSLDGGKGRRVEPLALLSQQFQCAITYRLTQYLTVLCHTIKDPAATMIQHCAQALCSLAPLSGCGLELYRLRLTGACPDKYVLT
jgi:hypothetical protein